MNGGVNSITDPPPPDLGGNQVSLQTGVILDNTPALQTFGQAIQQPPAFVMQSGVVDVTFRAGHPKNDLMTGGSYYFIQRLTGGSWADAVWDSMPEGRFTWKRDADILCKGCSTVSVHWDVPSDAIPGTYRIKHVGARKDGGKGTIRAMKVSLGPSKSARPGPPARSLLVAALASAAAASPKGRAVS